MRLNTEKLSPKLDDINIWPLRVENLPVIGRTQVSEVRLIRPIIAIALAIELRWELQVVATYLHWCVSGACLAASCPPGFWFPWWRHQMEAFSRHWPLVRGIHRWILITKAIDAELWCFFDLRLKKRLSKQSRRWWFGRHRAHYDVTVMICIGLFPGHVPRLL